MTARPHSAAGPTVRGTGWRRRICTAVVAAAMICAPLPAVAASGEVTAVAWGHGGYGGYGGYGGSGGYGSGSGATAVVDSDPATSAESKGVVLIDTTLTGGEGAGTGIVLTAGGQVLTNYHVVEGATAISVTVASTGDTYTAEVVGHSATADVALLQLEDATGLTPATLDDDSVSAGDDVTAVGNAGGTGELTAADGDVLTLAATITTQSEYGIAGETLHGLIETDADVVAGDSGGPLLDEEGEVVGIDTAASSGTVINGYAIPIDDAMVVVTQIRSGESVGDVQVGSSGFLGVQLAAADSTGSGGAVIEGVVPESAADRAGLVAGDVVTAVGGTAVRSADELSAALADTSAGDQLEITWQDVAGGDHSDTVTLGERPTA